MYKFKSISAITIGTILVLTIWCNPAISGEINITSTGRVGIGTSTPASKLAVNGTITAKEIVVTDAAWADYVFSPGYQILPLDELARFVKTHQRLPNIPPESKLMAEGLPVSKLMALQMEKIEELTLYLIALKDENKKLNARIEKIENTRP